MALSTALFIVMSAYALFVYCEWPAPQAVFGDISGVSEPCMIKKDKTYYMFSSNGQIQTRVSVDRTNWTYVGNAIRFFGDVEL